MNAHDFLARHGEQSERIVVAQVALGRERKLGEIGEGFYLMRMHSGRVESRTVMRDVVIGVFERPAQALELQRLELVTASGLAGLELAG